MDLKQLHALLAIADHGSFSAAASALNTVQSNVSTRVARLERELRVELVDRGSRALTPAGLAVADRARRLAGEMNAIPSDIAALNDEVRGAVAAGVIASTARWLVPRMLTQMAIQQPHVTLSITEAPTNNIVPAVAHGALDGGVVSLPADSADVIVEPLFEEDVVLVVPPDHELAGEQGLDMRDLTGVPMVLPPVGTPLRNELDAEFARVNVALIPQCEVNGIRLIESLVVRGVGPALLPATAAPEETDPVRVTVHGLRRRRVALITSRRMSPSVPALAVAEVLRQVVRANASGLSGVYLPDLVESDPAYAPPDA